MTGMVAAVVRCGTTVAASVGIAVMPSPVFGASSAGDASGPQDVHSSSPAAQVSGQIVVTGARIDGLPATIDDELDETGIAAYGVNTIGDLLEQLGVEAAGADERDRPVVLINGEPAAAYSDISDLPAEALLKVQLLRQEAAARLGQSAVRRVINVMIKPDLRQLTANGSGRLATRGKGGAFEGEANLLRLDRNNRTSVVLRARATDPLFESDRGIVQDPADALFDPAGNIVASGSKGAEIDPLLSAAAGRTVTVAGVPAGVARPGLADFVHTANLANLSNGGAFRTLLGRTEAYSASTNVTRRISDKTTLSLSARAEQTYGESFLGLQAAQFTVPAGSAASPFSRDVVVLRAFGEPLAQRSRSTNLTFNQSLNSRIGKYALTVLGNVGWRKGRTQSDRDRDLAAWQNGILGGTINPFAPIDGAVVGAARRDISRTTAFSPQVQAIVSGPVVQLPGGPALVAFKLGVRHDRITSSNTGIAAGIERDFRRTEKTAQLNLTIPLFGKELADAIGDATLDLTGALRGVSSIRTLHDAGWTLSWDPARTFNLRYSWNVEETAPPAYALNDPLLVTENVRTFDFVRQESVLVRYVTGGNPDLPVQRRYRSTIAATWRPFGGNGLTLNADYQRDTGRNIFASLPPADARVQLAFADRYIRDQRGVLIRLDARPVTYERDRAETLHWGIAAKRTFGGEVGSGEGDDDARRGALSAGRGWRVNFNLDHNWSLSKTRLIRSGLPVIDLLGGGALGSAGGQPRHVLRAATAIYHAGIGLTMDAGYRGGSKISAGTSAAPETIRFSGRTLVDARLFANLGPRFPDSALAKGMRVSIGVDNLFDSRQIVRDQSGRTPINYQPFLIDPLGRTVTLALRKVF